MLRRIKTQRPSRVRLFNFGWTKRRADAVWGQSPNFPRGRAPKTDSTEAQVLLRNSAKQTQVGRSLNHASASPRNKSINDSRLRITFARFPSTNTSAGRKRAL